MVQHGTVVNGVIVPDGPPPPDGTRVRFRVAEAADGSDDVVPPDPPETYEERLAALRQSIEDMKAGRGRPLDEVMAEIAAEFNLPPVRPG